MRRNASFACGICRESFDDEKLCPRLLNCGHSFCGGCLEKLIQAAVVICPNCRKEAPVPYGVNGLAKNFALLDVLLMASKEEDKAVRVCAACNDKHEARSTCLDCKENFCEQASLWHTRTKLTSKHRVVSFEELERNPQLLQASNTCPNHDETFRFFDQDCGHVICRDCFALNHNGHKCSSLPEAAAKCREEIGAKVEQVVGLAKQVEAAETRAAGVSQSLDENFERAAAKIRAAFQKIHEAATAREALLVQELTQHHKAKSMALTHQRDLLYVSRACLESVGQRTQSAIKSQDDVQLLVARSDLTSTLAALAAQPMNPEADDVVAFAVYVTKILGAINTVGAVSDKLACAANTTAEAKTWRVRSGEKASFKIIARDDKGERRGVGSDTFVIQLWENHVQIPQDIDVEHKGDGTYEVTYTLPRDAAGDYKLSVCVNDAHIQGSPFVLGLGPFSKSSGQGAVVSAGGAVASNPTRHPHSVFGWKRVKHARWTFHIDAWAMIFGVVDAKQDTRSPGITFNSPGSFGIGAGHTYANGRQGTSDMKLLPGDDVQVKLKGEGGGKTLVVTNLRSKLVESLPVPAGKYRLHIHLLPHAQVTWKKRMPRGPQAALAG